MNCILISNRSSYGPINWKMQKTCLVVIDGWGIDSNEAGNAVKAANTPCMTRLSNEFPFMPLSASGLDV
jgi:2,3-bisphosphoglycerate-independent phosphoglycerate mutase